MTSTKNKPGRKQKPHVTTYSNETIDGLYHCPDGRWRINATGEKFTEHDERLAVARFRQWESRNGGKLSSLPIPLPKNTFADLLEAAKSKGPRQAATDFAFAHIPSMDFEKNEEGTISLIRRIPEDVLFSWFRDQLFKRPQYVAQQVGIEQIGYLTDLVKPEPSPSLVEVGELSQTKQLSNDWMQKATSFWTEFCEFVGVKTLREIDQSHIVSYGDAIKEKMRTGNLSPTFVRQRFQAVRSIIKFPPKRGKWAEDCHRVAAFCSVLIPPTKADTDPQPIRKGIFRAMLANADVQMTALLLVMLNACMYGGEAVALHWDEINLEKGSIVTRRNKTSVIRIAVLWPETIAALVELQKISAVFPFKTSAGTQHCYKTIYRHWQTLRATVSGATNVQLAHVRDGAYTAAVEAGIELDRCKLLAGHATGISDAYVKRSPKMVADACAAIHKEYLE